MEFRTRTLMNWDLSLLNVEQTISFLHQRLRPPWHILEDEEQVQNGLKCVIEDVMIRLSGYARVRYVPHIMVLEVWQDRVKRGMRMFALYSFYLYSFVILHLYQICLKVVTGIFSLSCQCNVKVVIGKRAYIYTILNLFIVLL